MAGKCAEHVGPDLKQYTEGLGLSRSFNFILLIAITVEKMIKHDQTICPEPGKLMTRTNVVCKQTHTCFFRRPEC